MSTRVGWVGGPDHRHDLIVQGSVCAGFDCVTDESFGFDTIRLKENNTRIAFDDTMLIGFPANDWQILANDSASGGLNYLAFEDTTAGAGTGAVPASKWAPVRTRSTSRAAATRTGTSTRLSYPDIATGMLAICLGAERQRRLHDTLDVAGNEANFFVRDVTGGSGSRLPFRIRPGALRPAPSTSRPVATSASARRHPPRGCISSRAATPRMRS